MLQQNLSTSGLDGRSFDSKNITHLTDMIQSLTLVTCDEITLLQLSKNWGREERRNKEDNHTLATQDREIYNGTCNTMNDRNGMGNVGWVLSCIYMNGFSNYTQHQNTIYVCTMYTYLGTAHQCL